MDGSFCRVNQGLQNGISDNSDVSQKREKKIFKQLVNASRIQIVNDFLERKNKKRTIRPSIDVTLKTEKWCQKMQFEMLFFMVSYTNDNTSKSMSLS